MVLRTFIPGEDLRPWIDAVWVRSAGRAVEPVAILPDGCADVVIDLGRGEAFAVGAMTRPLFLEGQMAEMVGIRFRPGRAGSFLGIPAGAITDERLPLASWSSLATEAASIPASRRVDVIESAIRQRLGRVSAEQRVDAAVEMFLRSSGTAAVETTARAVNVTRQHLARLFHEHVGLTPKMFARIVRFRRAAALGRRMPWPDVAAALGYADQSHLIAEFRVFGGTSPVPFLLSRRGEQR